ncbi:DUF6477 family protein [Thalassovita taeanensis]|uniref:Uncharacterized protein n=1 Tax=Thalassovita taeanensis TaxID=657014 RepID=A0A1H8ZA46_9RHOB|nr:DUF6477 family protein [Thalassovita taeanensis]SEP60478.1 hypothetical protein SAMN04488092_101334 [Thalassovita taeanensis]
MNDLMGMLNTLRRPRLLIRAARIGVDDYRRDIHLRRVLGQGALPRSGPALIRLMELEDALNEQRRGDEAGYSPIRHVEILIAMMGEARVLRASALAAAPV